MGDTLQIALLLPGIFLGVVLFVGLGRRLAARRQDEAKERERAALNTIEASVYALLGLMVAFTYAEAAARFETRRAQTIDEANAIGTAYLRIELLEAAARPAMRERFRRYTQERIAVYQSLPDLGASDAHSLRAGALQNDIWRESIAGLRSEPMSSSLLLLPALNEMFDITTTRAIYLRTHTPPAVGATLLVLCFVCAILLGYGLPRERTKAVLLHTLGYAFVLTTVLYLIFDLDHPRAGLIRLDYADRAMQLLLDSMAPPGGSSAR
jgi:hypothetical protein